MYAAKITLIALVAAAVSADPPSPPKPRSLSPTAEADSTTFAEKIRDLERRVARLERVHGGDLVAPGMRAVEGAWRIEGAEIVSPDNPLALLQLPQHPTAEYSVSLRVRRLSGNNTFAIGVPFHGKQVLVAIDAHAGTVGGLEYLDGRFVHENEATYRGRLFVSEAPATIAVTVGKNRITCAFNDTIVVDWSGDAKRLSLPDSFAVPDRAALFLATLGSSYAVSEIRLSPMDRATTSLE